MSSTYPYKPTVYLDMDEVLKDFQSSTLRCSGVDTDDPAVIEILSSCDWGKIEALTGGREAFCRPVDLGGQDYWRNLPTLPWATDLIAAIKTAPVDLIVVTSPACWYPAAEVKIHQIVAEFGLDYCVCAAKYKLAAPSKLLVDDATHNVVKFREYGGKAVQWPTPALFRSGARKVEEAINEVMVAVWDLVQA